MGSWIVIGEAIWMVALIVTAIMERRIISNKWRVLYVVPALLTCMLAFCVGFNPYLVGMIVAGVLAIIQIDMKKHIVKVALSAAGILALLGSLGPGKKAAERIDFTGDFEKAFSTMKEHYVLDIEKGIDWDALYAEYAPKLSMHSS